MMNLQINLILVVFFVQFLHVQVLIQVFLVKIIIKVLSHSIKIFQKFRNKVTILSVSVIIYIYI